MKIKDKIILIAEDEIVNILLLEVILTAIGIKVKTAENGRIAVDLVKLSSFDMVFMDIKMPVMDGIEATKEIRKFNKNIDIIAQTAFKNKRQECLDVGFTDFISKPYTKKKIYQIVNKYLTDF